MEIDEHAPAGTVVLDRPSDRRLMSNFRIESGNEHSCFEIDANSGCIRVSSSVNLDFETQPEFRLVVSASPPEDAASRFESDFEASLIDSGVSAENLKRLRSRRVEATVMIRLRDVNESPDLKVRQFSIPESLIGGTFVGFVTGSDPDDGDVLNYSILSGNDDQTFELDSASGALSVRLSAQLDFEHTRQYDLTVQISDSGGLQATADVAILIQDVDEPPVVDQSNLTWVIESDSPAEVGTLSAMDPDSDGELTYQLIDDPTKGSFCIDPTSGVVTLFDALRLREFNGRQCRLTIDVRDQTGKVTRVPVTIVLRLPVAVRPLPAVEPPPPVAADKTSQRLSASSEKPDVSHSSQFNQSVPEGVYGLALLAGLVALVPVVVPLLRRKALLGREHTVSASLPPDLVLSNAEMLELLIASEAYVNEQRGADFGSVEPVEHISIVSTPIGEAPSHASGVENSSAAGHCPSHLSSSEHFQHDVEDSERPTEQSFHSSQDETSDDAVAATASSPQSEHDSTTPDHAVEAGDTVPATASPPQSTDDTTPPDHAIETDDAVPSTASQLQLSHAAMAVDRAVEMDDNSPSLMDSYDVDKCAIRDYVSKLLERDQRRIPGPASNHKSGDRRSQESSDRRRHTDRDDSEHEKTSSRPHEQPDVEDADTVDQEQIGGQEVRRFLREFMLREFLRNNTNHFRELSRRSSDAAIATAAWRRARKALGPRIMLTAFFILASLAAIIASILNLCEFGAIGQILLLAAFCSTAELRLTVRRWRSRARRISDDDGLRGKRHRDDQSDLRLIGAEVKC